MTESSIAERTLLELFPINRCHHQVEAAAYRSGDAL